jgi:hypothetical protein
MHSTSRTGSLSLLTRSMQTVSIGAGGRLTEGCLRLIHGTTFGPLGKGSCSTVSAAWHEGRGLDVSVIQFLIGGSLVIFYLPALLTQSRASLEAIQCRVTLTHALATRSRMEWPSSCTGRGLWHDLATESSGMITASWQL